ncbi:hypothetical protein CYMTET_28103, partial [Cymbomonas tetramitiformis]
DAYVEVSHTEWTKVYFIVFWLVVGTYAFNVLVSYILETVLNLMAEIEREKESEVTTPRESMYADDGNSTRQTVAFKKARSMSTDVAQVATRLSLQIKSSLKFRGSLILKKPSDAEQLDAVSELADACELAEELEENQEMNGEDEKKDASTEDASPGAAVQEPDGAGPLDEASADEYGTFAKPRQASTG